MIPKKKKICAKFGFKMNSIIYAVFLTSLAKEPLYGYLLVEKLKEYGIESSLVPYGAAYRILRSMEENGLVISRWETSGNGPAKRIYEITDEGFVFLRKWLISARKNFEIIEKILNKIEEVLGNEDK